MRRTKKQNSLITSIVISITSLILLILFIDINSGFSSLNVTKFDMSQVILDTNGKTFNVSLSANDEWCVPISLDKTGYWTQNIVIALEDKRFYEHHGFDIIAIARAFFSNISSGRRISGASTITSQLIRISKPRKRTLYNKILEFWSALRLENRITKDEILELYLNRAPMGGNIRGVEAASNAYFNKSAESLSLGETVILISLLASPSRYRPDRFPGRALELRNKKLDYLFQKNIISSQDIFLAKSEYLPALRYPIPSAASMAAMHIKAQSRDDPVIDSAIDSRLQLLLETNISDALRGFPVGITGSGIIVENSTGFVRAYVGNSKHGTSLPEAQVDCGGALRSPGSTLKPFIYGAAFDMGLLTPSSLIADTPLAFRGNAPRNFDMSYRGPVSTRTALAASLNTPAVRALRMVGYVASKAVLNRFGFSHINEPPQHYTDSLILGGCEVTLTELAAAYSALANGGLYVPLRWTTRSAYNARQVMSPETSYLVTDVLQDERRLTPIYQEISRGLNMRVAFKTGTSYGLRDAWTAGYSRNYTVVVWIGSPPGIGNPALVGMQAAAPLLLKIIREIWDDSEKPFERPNNIYQRLVCSLSGDIPNKYCPSTVSDIAIRNTSKTRSCSLHKNINGKTYISWPPELRTWIQPYEDIASSQKNVKIIRPSEGHTVIIQKGSGTEKIFLAAEGDYPHYWYLDGKFIGICQNEGGLFAAVSSGTHKASVLSGNTSESVTFDAKTPMQLREGSTRWNENIIN
jgi:penicillin-binding protein 1C